MCVVTTEALCLRCAECTRAPSGWATVAAAASRRLHNAQVLGLCTILLCVHCRRHRFRSRAIAAVPMPLPVHNLKHTPRGKTLFVYHMHSAGRLDIIFLVAALCCFCCSFDLWLCAVSGAAIDIKVREKTGAVCNRTRLIEWNMIPSRSFSCACWQSFFDRLQNGKMRSSGSWKKLWNTFSFYILLCCQYWHTHNIFITWLLSSYHNLNFPIPDIMKSVL